VTEPNVSPEDITTPPGESGLTSDPPGSVGQQMEPIGGNLEQSGDADGDDRGTQPDESGRQTPDATEQLS
jgi:hypothetical protein